MCMKSYTKYIFFVFFQAEDGIRDFHVTGVQTCALPIFSAYASSRVDASPDGGEPSAGASSARSINASRRPVALASRIPSSIRFWSASPVSRSTRTRISGFLGLRARCVSSRTSRAPPTGRRACFSRSAASTALRPCSYTSRAASTASSFSSSTERLEERSGLAPLPLLRLDWLATALAPVGSAMALDRCRAGLDSRAAPRPNAAEPTSTRDVEQHPQCHSGRSDVHIRRVDHVRYDLAISSIRLHLYCQLTVIHLLLYALRAMLYLHLRARLG